MPTCACYFSIPLTMGRGTHSSSQRYRVSGAIMTRCSTSKSPIFSGWNSRDILFRSPDASPASGKSQLGGGGREVTSFEAERSRKAAANFLKSSSLQKCFMQ